MKDRIPYARIKAAIFEAYGIGSETSTQGSSKKQKLPARKPYKIIGKSKNITRKKQLETV